MTDAQTSDAVSIHLKIEGSVQGVGFRPFLVGLAQQHGVGGWVRNTTCGVEAGLQGHRAAIDRMIRDIEQLKPAPARVAGISVAPASSQPGSGFRIEASVDTSYRARIPTDTAPCPKCITELEDPANRRYRYPFITCSECGPRFSVTEGARFDRALTSMRDFALCAECRREYESPNNRRFHAQTISCPQCGPVLMSIDKDGCHSSNEDALLAAVQHIASGNIVAVKGVGGYQWICDATSVASVSRLREIKHRPDKPFAVMVSSLAMARRYCRLEAAQEQSLVSAAAPIVLAATRDDAGQQHTIVPGVGDPFPLRGVMLPSSCLHELLLRQCDRPLVVTSANCRGEPMIIDDAAAIALLSQETDLVLTHNRRITHRVDDALVRIIDGQQTLLRNGRGFAPTSVSYTHLTLPTMIIRW